MTDESPQSNTVNAEDAKRAVRNVGILMGASVLSKGFLFFWQIFLNNWLGPTQAGIYSTVFGLFAVIVPLTGTAMGMIVIREVAKKPDQIGKFATIMLFTQTGLAGIAYIVLVLAGSLYGGDILAYTAIVGLSLFVDILGNIAHDLFIAQEQMGTTSVMEITHVTLRILLAGGALVFGWGLMGVYLATIAVSIIRASVLWAFLLRQDWQLDWDIDWGGLGIPTLLNTLPLSTGAMLSLGYDHADKLMMTGIIGETNTGYLNPAFLIHFGVIELFSTAILVAMFPLMSKYHQDNDDTFGFIVQTLMRFMLMLALPVTLALTVFSDDVVRLLFSDEFLPTIPILRVYVWYTLLTLVSNVFARALLVQNRQLYILIVTASALTLNIIVNYILLTQTGNPIGAAVASVVAQGLALILLAQTFRANGFDLLAMIPRLLRLGLIGGAMTITMIIVGQIGWIIGAIVGTGVYALGVLFGNVLSTADWDLLYRLTGAMPGGSLIRRYWHREMTNQW